MSSSGSGSSDEFDSDYLLPAAAAHDQQRGLAAACSQQDPGLAFIREVQQLQHHLATYVQSGGAAATYEHCYLAAGQAST